MKKKNSTEKGIVEQRHPSSFELALNQVTGKRQVNGKDGAATAIRNIRKLILFVGENHLVML